MARSEAARLSKKNEKTAPSDLTAAMASIAQQNTHAAQSTIPGDDTSRQHDGLSKISGKPITRWPQMVVMGAG